MEQQYKMKYMQLDQQYKIQLQQIISQSQQQIEYIKSQTLMNNMNIILNPQFNTQTNNAIPNINNSLENTENVNITFIMVDEKSPDVEINKLYVVDNFKGKNMDDRVTAGFLTPEKPIYHVGYSFVLESLYQRALDEATKENAYSQQLMAGIVNHMIGLMYSLERMSQKACAFSRSAQPTVR